MRSLAAAAAGVKAAAQHLGTIHLDMGEAELLGLLRAADEAAAVVMETRQREEEAAAAAAAPAVAPTEGTTAAEGLDALLASNNDRMSTGGHSSKENASHASSRRSNQRTSPPASGSTNKGSSGGRQRGPPPVTLEAFERAKAVREAIAAIADLSGDGSLHGPAAKQYFAEIAAAVELLRPAALPVDLPASDETVASHESGEHPETDEAGLSAVQPVGEISGKVRPRSPWCSIASFSATDHPPGEVWLAAATQDLMSGVREWWCVPSRVLPPSGVAAHGVGVVGAGPRVAGAGGRAGRAPSPRATPG